MKNKKDSMDKDFLKKLKTVNPSLYQVHKFIVDAKKLGYGEISFDIKSHNYVSKIIQMKAVKPKKKALAKSITKRIMVDSKK